MAHAPSSVLTPPPQPLGLAVLASIGLHVMGIIVFAGWTLICSGSTPVLDVKDSIEIDFAMVKQADGMPQIATRLANPPSMAAPEPAAAPEPVPQPPSPAAPVPPPPRESDLIRNVPQPAPVPNPEPPIPEPVRPTPAPVPAPVRPAPAAPDRSSDMERALAEARRQQALDDARIGAQNREATDPNGNADENISSSGSGSPADPRLARWKVQTERVFQDAFNPLQTDPALKAIVSVYIDANTGTVQRSEISRSSGNASFDAAALRSAASITQIEPPPAEFRSIVGTRLNINYVPK